MSRSDETDLINRAREGDGRAFQALCNRYTADLDRQLQQRVPPWLRSKVSSQDILQEARITALQRLDSFDDRGEGSFRAWLTQIVEWKLREAINHYQDAAKRDVRREVERTARPPTGQLKSAHATPSQWAIAAETEAAAARAFAKLRPDYQTVILLVQEEELSLEQVAQRMERSYDAAKKLHARAVARFEQLLRLEQEPQ